MRRVSSELQGAVDDRIGVMEVAEDVKRGSCQDVDGKEI
jgi:hypothetical protein